MDSEPDDPMEEGLSPTAQEGYRTPLGTTKGGEGGDSVSSYHSPHLEQVSMAAYHRQMDEYTQEAVHQLKASPEYKKHTQRCSSCAAVWYEGGVGEACIECGGYAMQRPCPICSGVCGRVWRRSVDTSHSFHEAHWDGECGLSEQQRTACLLRSLVAPDQNELTEALEDLGI